LKMTHPSPQKEEERGTRAKGEMFPEKTKLYPWRCFLASKSLLCKDSLFCSQPHLPGCAPFHTGLLLARTSLALPPMLTDSSHCPYRSRMLLFFAANAHRAEKGRGPSLIQPLMPTRPRSGAHRDRDKQAPTFPRLVGGSATTAPTCRLPGGGSRSHNRQRTGDRLQGPLRLTCRTGHGLA